MHIFSLECINNYGDKNQANSITGRIRRLAVAFLVSSLCFAKEPKHPESYNYQRGIELLLSDPIDDGIEFLQKELHQNPKNGYAEVWLVVAYARKKEIGIALHYAEDALKHLPKSDKYYHAWIHVMKGWLSCGIFNIFPKNIVFS